MQAIGFDPNYIKLFRLAQLIIEYLLVSLTSQTKFLVISFHLLHLIPSHCLGNLDLNFQFIFMLAFSAVSFGKS